jgi:phage gp36-like protein
MTTLYATVEQLQQVLAGTDGGSGTAAKLTEAQLTLALTAGSNRVSVYIGGVYDSSTPASVPPAILTDLTLDLAAYWATTYYLKNKTLEPTHPVAVRYTSAMEVLEAARTGSIRLDVGTAGSIESETGLIINRIPRIFTGKDSNTRINGLTGSLEADTPYYEYRPGWQDLDAGGPVYQG